MDRYFYYMAICIGQDANTEVTGYGGREQGRSKEEREQAMADAKKITKEKTPEIAMEKTSSVVHAVPSVVVGEQVTGTN